jgi:hypothetical protein
MSVPDCFDKRSMSASAADVSMNPGATVLTRIPLGPTSFDKPLLYVVSVLQPHMPMSLHIVEAFAE